MQEVEAIASEEEDEFVPGTQERQAPNPNDIEDISECSLSSFFWSTILFQRQLV